MLERLLDRIAWPIVRVQEERIRRSARLIRRSDQAGQRLEALQLDVELRRRGHR